MERCEILLNAGTGIFILVGNWSDTVKQDKKVLFIWYALFWLVFSTLQACTCSLPKKTMRILQGVPKIQNLEKLS